MKEWLAAFHFLRPEWLWLLLAAPVIYFSLTAQDSSRARWKRYIAPELLDHLIVTRKNSWQLRPIHTLVFLMVVASIALAGPSWKREQLPFAEDKAPLVVAVDLSPTMDAIDLDPTRIERVKLKLRDLLKLRNGGRTALFVYAGTTHMVLPFTMDSALLDLYLDSISTSLMPVAGKDSRLALRTVQEFLKTESLPGTILFVTDGIEPAAVATFEEYSSQTSEKDKDDILILAAGTSHGGPVRVSANQFLTDGNGARVYSKVDLDALRSVSGSSVAVSSLTLNDDDVQWIQRHVQHHLQAAQMADNKTQRLDEGYWLTIPIVCVAMFWFRKGWTVRWNSAVFTIFLIAAPGGGGGGFSWMDLFLTPDQQGRYYFERSEYARAAEAFEDPMLKGIALARVGKYQDALNEFALSDSADAWFNQGDALVHLGKYPEAVNAFRQALLRRNAWPEAQENLKLAQSLIPPPKKKPDAEVEVPPDEDPDKIQFDEKGKKGKKATMQVAQMDPKKLTEIWMRNIQTTPADFLRQRFQMQATQERHR
jgi:Ca-activated chloride channel homolog